MKDPTKQFLKDAFEIVRDAGLPPVEARELLNGALDHTYLTGQIDEIERMLRERSLDCPNCGGVMYPVGKEQDLWRCEDCRYEERR